MTISIAMPRLGRREGGDGDGEGDDSTQQEFTEGDSRCQSASDAVSSVAQAKMLAFNTRVESNGIKVIMI